MLDTSFFHLNHQGFIMARLLLIVWVLLIGSVTQAYAQDDEQDFLYDFLKGNYTIVGRYPESNVTYSGTLILERTTNELKMTIFQSSRFAKKSSTAEDG